MAVAGVLEIQMMADMARLRSDMNRATGTVQTATDKMSRAFGTVTKAVGILGAAMAVRFFTGFVRETIDAQDALSKMSRSTNIAVQDLAGLQHAADLGGVSQEALSKSLTKLSRVAWDAGQGMQSATEFFDALGLSVRDNNGNLKDSLDITFEVAEAFRNMEDSTEKTAIAMGLFGRAGTQLIPTLNEGAEGLRAMMEEGKRLNPVTEESARNAEIFNDNLTRLTKLMRVGFLQSVNDILPFLADMTDYLWEASKQANDSEEGFSIFAETLRALIILGLEFRFVWQQIGIAIAGVGAQIQGYFDNGVAGLQNQRKLVDEILVQNRKEHDQLIERVATWGKLEKSARDARRAEAESRTRGTRVAIPGADASDPIADLIDSQSKSAEKQLETMQRRVDLYGETSEAARVMWEIEQGGLTMADQGTQDRLLNAAKELDALNAKKEAAENAARSEHEFRQMQMEIEQQWQDQLRETWRIQQAEIEARQNKLDGIIEANTTELQLLADKLDAELAFVEAARDDNLISLTEYHELVLSMTSRFEQRKKDIAVANMTELEKFNQKSWKNQTSYLIDSMVNMTAGVSQGSRAMFEINKAFSIAQIAMKTPEAIASSFAFGSSWGGPVGGAAMAALAAAAMAAQAAQVMSVQFGSGVAPSVGGNVPAPPVSTVPQGGSGENNSQTTIVNFVGNTNERETVRKFVSMLNENSRDGSKIFVSGAS